MDKASILCPNCLSAIHLGDSNDIECQRCGLVLDNSYEELDCFLERTVEDAISQDNLSILQQNRARRIKSQLS